MAIEIQGNCFDFAQVQSTGLQLLHGGAGPMDPQKEQFLLATKELENISTACLSSEILKSKPFLKETLEDMSAAEKRVLSAVSLLENHPLYNAGVGASLQADGKARVSASFMESSRQKFSAVVNLEHIKNPSHLVYYLQKERFSALDHRGGEALAKKLGVPSENLVTDDKLKKWQAFQAQNNAGKTGTVGSVCLSPDGKLAALTSTGGVGNETVGRIGDSPTVAGNFCDSFTAISCTGYGEQIVALGLAVKVATRVQDGMTLSQSLKITLDEAQKREFHLGLIAVHYNKSKQYCEWAAASVNAKLLWSYIGPQ